MLRRAGCLVPLSLWLACLSFGACESEVREEREEEEPSCAVACGEANPKGLDLFNNVSPACVCHDCTGACRESICEERHGLQDDACLPCVQTALRSGCERYGLFDSGCYGHPECSAFVDCLLECPTS